MTMARYQFTVTDGAGNVVPSCHIEVRREESGLPLAALKSDRAGTVPLSNPFDADADGFAFFHAKGGAFKIRVYTGPSGAPTSERIWRYVAVGELAEQDVGPKNEILLVAPGPYAAQPTDDVLIVNQTVAAPFTVTVDWSQRSRPLRVVDGKGDAATNNITITPAAGQTQLGTLNYSYVIDGNGGSIILTPLPDGTGAY